MSSIKMSFWDFKSYDETRWFKFLAINIIAVAVIYILAHIYSNIHQEEYNFEYDSISKEKMTLLNQITVDSSIKNAGERSNKIMQYIDNIFNNKLEKGQRISIERFLKTAKPSEIIPYLSITRFKVESFFWLIGPFVYLEIVFCAVFGVFSSLLFNMGIVVKNRTTDIADPSTTFDPSEVPYQVAKILYAPICTLAVILGYNYFKDENMVDISSSKGMIAFAFICGFYSGRLIALMDRLKEVLLPTNAILTSGTSNAATVSPIKQLLVRVTVDASKLSTEQKALMGKEWWNDTEVCLNSVSTQSSYKGTRSNADAAGVFNFSNFYPGNYVITAKYNKAEGEVKVSLSASVTGTVASGNAPIDMVMK